MAVLERTLSSNLSVSDPDGNVDLQYIYNYVAENSATATDFIYKLIYVNGVLTRTLSDNAEINDFISRDIFLWHNALDRILSSTLDVSDGDIKNYTVSNYIADNGINIYDLIGIVTGGATALNRVLSDSISLSDLSLDQRITEIIIAEVIAVTDASHVNPLLTRLLQSGISVTDLVNVITSAEGELPRILTSSVAVNDTLDVNLLLARLLQSNIDINDLIALIEGNILSAILSSNVDINDSSDIQKHFSRLLQSNADTNDIIGIIEGIIYEVTIGSSISIDDDMTRQIVLGLQQINKMIVEAKLLDIKVGVDNGSN